jgi:hypothetical protein
MGSVGDSYEENLWMLIKTEGLHGRTFTTRAEANLALFEYIDGFYNSRRIQERLGFLSPIEFEEKYYAEQATAEPTNLNTRQPLLTSGSRMSEPQSTCSTMCCLASTRRTVMNHCSHSRGLRGSCSACRRNSPHAGQRPPWPRRSRAVCSSTGGAFFLRRRSVQYSAMAGSSGDAPPWTGTCWTIFVQANLVR